MTDNIVTATFAHLSDADASRAVLESSIPGIDVALQSDANVTTREGVADEAAEGPWKLTANVPDGMRDDAESLLHQTVPAAND